MITLKLHRQDLKTDAKGHIFWDLVTEERQTSPRECALLICDMWDRHWSRGATERVNEMAPHINRAAKVAREKGFLIIHSPSETLDFYENHPARQRIEDIPLLPALNPSLGNMRPQYPPLPIDDSDGGSDTNKDGSETTNQIVWTRQHSIIEIDPDQDIISDMGWEIAIFLRTRSIDTIFICGVHTNMCILNRTFGIKQMLQWGFKVALIRDLTDAMYNPAMSPYVSHEEGTNLVVGYIEKFLCPTLESTDFFN